MDILGRYQGQQGNGDQEKVVYVARETGKGGVVIKFLMKISGGHVQNERQANIVLSIIAVIFFAASIYVVFGSLWR